MLTFQNSKLSSSGNFESSSPPKNMSFALTHIRSRMTNEGGILGPHLVREHGLSYEVSMTSRQYRERGMN